MNVSIEPFWKHYPIQQWPVVRITKNWIVVRYNEISTQKYNRKDGYPAGAFRELANVPSKIIKTDLDACNKLADENGGTWDGEPKRVRRPV